MKIKEMWGPEVIVSLYGLEGLGFCGLGFWGSGFRGLGFRVYRWTTWRYRDYVRTI